MTCYVFLTAGGDLCRALPGNACLAWYHLGHRIALDVARALHYLHSHEVCTSRSSCCVGVAAAGSDADASHRRCQATAM
jgi:hypothetical protein